MCPLYGNPAAYTLSIPTSRAEPRLKILWWKLFWCKLWTLWIFGWCKVYWLHSFCQDILKKDLKLYSGELTWQWNMSQFTIHFLLKNRTFHCHTSFSEGYPTKWIVAPKQPSLTPWPERTLSGPKIYYLAGAFSVPNYWNDTSLRSHKKNALRWDFCIFLFGSPDFETYWIYIPLVAFALKALKFTIFSAHFQVCYLPYIIFQSSRLQHIQVTIYFTPMRRGEHRLVVLGADGCEDGCFFRGASFAASECSHIFTNHWSYKPSTPVCWKRIFP